MKLLDKETYKSFNDLYLFLTPKEAKEVSQKLKILINHSKDNYIKIHEEDSKKQLSKEIIIKILK